MACITSWTSHSSRLWTMADENYSLIQCCCFPYMAKHLLKNDSPLAQKALKWVALWSWRRYYTGCVMISDFKIHCPSELEALCHPFHLKLQFYHSWQRQKQKREGTEAGENNDWWAIASAKKQQWTIAAACRSTRDQCFTFCFSLTRQSQVGWLMQIFIIHIGWLVSNNKVSIGLRKLTVTDK
jgi:hypothetical protein